MEVHLIRHTQVKVDSGVCYGQSDVALRDNFIDDFNQIKIDEDYDIVITSPLQRCTKLAEYFRFNYQKDSRIQEINFGTWELKNWDDISKNEIDPWYEDYIYTSPPKGESVIDFRKRILDFKNDLEQNYAGKKVLVVTHSGVVRLFLQVILDFPIKNMFTILPDYGKRCILKKEGGLWKILALNI